MPSDAETTAKSRLWIGDILAKALALLTLPALCCLFIGALIGPPNWLFPWATFGFMVLMVGCLSGMALVVAFEP